MRLLPGSAKIFLALALLAPMASAKSKAQPPADSRTRGLGKSCRSKNDCDSHAQVCMKESDANGKQLEQGICGLPCAAIDAGMSVPQMDPTPGNVEAAKKPPPPRCPKHYQCRSAGNGVPIDLCVKE